VNLAAFEMVDYVVMTNATSRLENIRLIRGPTISPRASKYGGNGLAAKTRRGLDVVHSYGGELIFTPGRRRSIHRAPFIKIGSAGRPARQLADRDGTLTTIHLRTKLRSVLSENGKGRKVHVVGGHNRGQLTLNAP